MERKRGAFTGRVLGRREFLVLAGTVTVAAGCSDGGEGEEGCVDTVISEPEEPGGSRETFEVSTSRGPVRGSLYPVEGAIGAVVMVGGAGGDTTGPAGVYEELAARLQANGIMALRLEYRWPSYLEECVYDLLAGIEALVQRGSERVALVGWSFGGAVVISAGAASDAVVGVATVASQTQGADAVGELSPEKSLLLIHGTADTVLPYELSQNLYALAGEPKELVLYPDDGHGIEGHRPEMLEKLYGWSENLLLSGSRAQTGES